MSNIDLDDTDDDLDLPPPPQNNNQYKDPISLDDSDGDSDGLPPPTSPGNQNNNISAVESLVLPGNSKPVSLDSDEDDLPPPSKPAPQVAATKQQATQPAAAAGKKPVAPAGGNKQPVPAAAAQQGGDRARAGTLKRRTISDASMEHHLFKQSPTWPYVMQKRYVTLKGRLLSYFEEKGSTNPSGTLDLKGVQIIDSPSNAKAPHAFGITGGEASSLKGRTFIFAASNRDEYLGWLDILKFVTTEPKNSEIHWFEKMAQGLF